MIIKKFFKRILLKTSIYDFYLSKNNQTKILITPHDPWPGDPAIGESIFQGDFNISSKNHFSTFWIFMNSSTRCSYINL